MTSTRAVHHHQHASTSPPSSVRRKLRDSIVTSKTKRRVRRFDISAGAFSAPSHSFDAPGNFRENLSVGLSVGIVLKEDQGTDAVVYGKISDFLTNSKRHPRGIKVRLEDGSIGRVREIGEGEEKEEAVSAKKGSSESDDDASDENDEEQEQEQEQDEQREEQSNVVYVRGLPKSKEDIEKVKEALVAIILDNESNNNNRKNRGVEKDDIVSVKIPKRSGSQVMQGFGFIECRDIETAMNVIRRLNGQILEIVESRSADDDDSIVRSSNNSENTKKLFAAFSVNKKKSKEDGPADTGKKKGKKSKLTKVEKERLEQDEREQQIIEARKAMEEDALKLLERQRRERERKEKEMQAKLEKEEIARQAKEKRTMELLLKRKEAQDRNRAKVQAEQERLDRIDGEAKALGDITIDESWLVEIEEIKATISALK